jgi:sulfite reductase (NADPH) flavoprotein alpha-component
LFHASEVVLHNNTNTGYWMIINGRVYDVSEFAHIHPGGIKIIQSYAGMDASMAYKKIQHDLNPEVDSLLSIYQLGAVRRLDFGSVGGVAITPKGLRFVSLTELYELWIRALYAVVEMENALLNDYSISHEQVTYNEKRGEPQSSLYRTQMLLQTHERFLKDYLSSITGTLLDNLWATTSGLCSTRQDYRWMKYQIAEIESKPESEQARTLGIDTLKSLKTSSPDQHPTFEAIANQLAEADKFFINKIKLELRRGLQIFEAFEKKTLIRAPEQLLEITQSLGQVLNEYYAHFDSIKSE